MAFVLTSCRWKFIFTYDVNIETLGGHNCVLIRIGYC